MKKLSILLVVIIITTLACNKGIDLPSDPGDEGNSSILWEYEIPHVDHIYSDIVLDENDNVYFFAESNKVWTLYSLNKDGKVNWTTVKSDGAHNFSILMYENGKLYLRNSSKDITAYDASNGSKLWNITFTLPVNDVALSNGVLYAVEASSVYRLIELYAYDANTGAIKWSESMDHSLKPLIAAYQNNVCLVLKNQNVTPHILN